MNKNDKLYMDYCSYRAAKYAVEHWHYSECMPVGKMVRIGVWEYGEYVGCILFSRGSNKALLSPYGLLQIDGCELTRIALKKHVTAVTKIIKIAVSMLKRTSPELKLIISFADSNQKQLGIIYQASNWIYTGKTAEEHEYYYQGKWQHRRSVGSTRGTIVGLTKRYNGHRLRYLMPLNKQIRKQIEKLRKPYPKKCPDGVIVAQPSFQKESGSSNLTSGLSI